MGSAFLIREQHRRGDKAFLYFGLTWVAFGVVLAFGVVEAERRFPGFAPAAEGIFRVLVPFELPIVRASCCPDLVSAFFGVFLLAIPVMFLHLVAVKEEALLFIRLTHRSGWLLAFTVAAIVLLLWLPFLETKGIREARGDWLPGVAASPLGLGIFGACYLSALVGLVVSCSMLWQQARDPKRRTQERHIEKLLEERADKITRVPRQRRFRLLPKWPGLFGKMAFVLWGAGLLVSTVWFFGGRASSVPIVWVPILLLPLAALFALVAFFPARDARLNFLRNVEEELSRKSEPDDSLSRLDDGSNAEERRHLVLLRSMASQFEASRQRIHRIGYRLHLVLELGLATILVSAVVLFSVLLYVGVLS
jgi:uncharacterized integral membrane protein